MSTKKIATNFKYSLFKKSFENIIGTTKIPASKSKRLELVSLESPNNPHATNKTKNLDILQPLFATQNHAANVSIMKDMENVTYNEDPGQEVSFKSRRLVGTLETPYMATLLIKWHLAKDEKWAGRILLTIVLVCFVGSVGAITFFILGSGSKPTQYHISPAVMMNLPKDVQSKIINANAKR